MHRWIVAVLILAVWMGWALLIVIAPENISIFHDESDKNYSSLGAFGDSFGVIASLMTTVGAVGIYMTFVADRDARKIQQFEQNFFTLVGNFESITRTINVPLQKKDKERKFSQKYHKLNRSAQFKTVKNFDGRSALSVILYLIRNEIQPDGYKDIKIVAKAYAKCFDKYVHHLGHYFRTLYQIYKLIDEKCPENKEYYARIIRAQLSNNELCLLAYNCIVGEGRLKFRNYAEEYAVFHNIHQEGLDDYEKEEIAFFIRKIKQSAFRFDKIIPITYDD
ncbi:hypothetical protein J2W40_000082 [Sphingobium xenophagum]|uniref:Phage abortive infection protein n=1 Tax=Sphingobium xenophagum TaxID=121428 RepID=A0ABU1WVG8_SPHXE|nr:putative phage abortive infection protein [Sphingobium xenophagum]MDR7153288.1 hypothetical protein [Sphingobium xenophagum]